MENTESYNQLVQTAFSDFQQEANVRQEAVQEDAEKKEQVQGILAPFEAEGLREGIGAVISKFKSKAIETAKKAGKEVLDKAKKVATDKLNEVKSDAETKFNDLKEQGQSKLEDLQNQAEELKNQAQSQIEDVQNQVQSKADELQSKADQFKNDDVDEEEEEIPSTEAQPAEPAEPAEATETVDAPPEFESEPIMETLKGDPSLPEGMGGQDQQLMTQENKAEGGADDQPTTSLENEYTGQVADEDMVTPPGTGDTELSNFAGDGEGDIENIGETLATDTAEQTSVDVGEAVAETALDVDPATAVVGLAIGIGSLLFGNLFQSHTEPPPQVDFNVASQLGVF
jgi:hypothetical protein